MTPENFSTN